MSRVHINTDRCQGHGRCLLEAPDVFDVSDIGKVMLLVDNIDDSHIEQVRAAVISCPEQVITLDD